MDRFLIKIQNNLRETLKFLDSIGCFWNGGNSLLDRHSMELTRRYNTLYVRKDGSVTLGYEEIDRYQFNNATKAEIKRWLNE